MGLLTRDVFDMPASEARLNVLLAQRDATSSDQVGNVVRRYEPNAVFNGAVGFELFDAGPDPLYVSGIFRASSWISDNACIAFVNGIKGPVSGQLFWDGYAGSTLGGNDTGENTTLQSWAVTVLPRLMRGLAPFTRQIWCGHSGGGAGLFYLARAQRTPFNNFLAPSCLVYGAPKPCRSENWNRTVWGTYLHQFNDDDPVPFIPPALTFWESFWSGLSRAQGNAIVGYTMWPLGIQLDVLGNLIYRREPSNLGAAPPTAIGNWLAAQTNNATTTHSLEAYLARTRLHNLSNPAPAPQPAPVYEVPRVRVPPSSAVVRTIEAAQEAIIVASDRPTGPAQTVLPPTRVFRAHRIGRIWYVSFNGSQVAIAPNKKRARGLARTGNDFLRRLLIEGQVDATSLVTGFRQFCQDASAEDGPYIPTMRVVG